MADAEMSQTIAATLVGLDIDFTTILASCIAAIIGAVIGGRYVKQGVFIADQKARKAEVERGRQEIENLRKALLVEIEALITSYQENAGAALESFPDGKPITFIYPTHQRYFVIFEENAHLIGKIPDDHERGLIVKAYTQAKGLMDSYQLNNTMTEKHNFAVGLGPVVLGQSSDFVTREIHRVMAEYNPVLKRMHYQALNLASALKESLSKPVKWA